MYKGLKISLTHTSAVNMGLEFLTMWLEF